MKLSNWAIILLVFTIFFSSLSEALIPVIEFNVSRSAGDKVFNNLPRRYLPIRNTFSWIENDTIYMNITRLVQLPPGDFAFSSNYQKNVIVNIEDGILSARPKQGWIGEQNIVVYIAGIDEQSIRLNETISRNKLLLETISLSELDSEMLDNVLYDMYYNRISKVVETNSYKESEIVARLDKEANRLVVNVGRDVEMTAEFVDQEGRQMPVVKVFVDAGLSNYEREIGHCSDRIRNFEEIEIDCGGECVECVSKLDLKGYSNILGILISGGLLGYAVVMIMRYNEDKRKKVVKNKAQVVVPSVRRLNIVEEIRKLKQDLREEEMKKTLVNFSRLYRDYFRLLLHIKHDFTYQELRDELTKRRIKNSIKENLVEVLKELSKQEYGSGEKDIAHVQKLFDEALEIIEQIEKAKIN